LIVVTVMDSKKSWVFGALVVFFSIIFDSLNSGSTAWHESIFLNFIDYIKKIEIRSLVVNVFDLQDMVTGQRE